MSVILLVLSLKTTSIKSFDLSYGRWEAFTKVYNVKKNLGKD